MDADGDGVEATLRSARLGNFRPGEHRKKHVVLCQCVMVAVTATHAHWASRTRENVRIGGSAERLSRTRQGGEMRKVLAAAAARECTHEILCDHEVRVEHQDGPILHEVPRGQDRVCRVKVGAGHIRR